MMMLLSLTTPFLQESKLAWAREGTSPGHSATMDNDAGCIWCLRDCKGCKGSNCEVTPELLFDAVVIVVSPLCSSIRPALRLAIVGGLIFVIIAAVAVVVADSCHGDDLLLNEGAGISTFLVGGPVGCRLQNVLVEEQAVAQAKFFGHRLVEIDDHRAECTHDCGIHIGGRQDAIATGRDLLV